MSAYHIKLVTSCLVGLLWFLRISEGKVFAVDLDPALEESWKTLLLYDKTLLTSTRGLMEGPSFYLHKGGQIHWREELETNLRAFEREGGLSPKGPGDYACRFPSRALWLGRHFSHSSEASEQFFSRVRRGDLLAPCEELRKWLREFDVSAMSLAYTSHYLGNAASIFGHTFLRFHKDPPDAQKKGAALFDPVVAFEAIPDTSQPIVYVFKGVFGLFPGSATKTPQYFRIQQYNNHESRDIWEYELSLSKDQVDRYMLLLFEIRQNHYAYYYFDVNCTYMILKTLDAVAPDAKLAAHAKPWVIPSDGIRVVHEASLVRDVRFRPSNRTIFEATQERVEVADRHLIPKLVDPASDIKSLLTPLATSSPSYQAKILDAALDFLDYKERVAGTTVHESHEARRKELLNMRAQLPNMTPVTPRPPHELRPDVGPSSSYASLGYRHYGPSQRGAEFLWRPAMRDELTISGVADGMASEVMLTRVFYDASAQSLKLTEFTALRLAAPAYVTDYETPLSWSFALGYVAKEQNALEIGLDAVQAQARAGYSVHVFDQMRLYSMVEGRPGGSFDGIGFVDGGVIAGIIGSNPGASMRGVLEFSLHGGMKNTGEHYRYPEATLSLAIPFKQSLGDIRLSGVARPSQRSLSITVGYFY